MLMMFSSLQIKNVQFLIISGGGKTASDHQTHESQRIVPHPRTLRKAREQIKCMVIDGASPRQIRNYLHRWVTWWVNASETWQYSELINGFIALCWDASVAVYAADLLQRHLIKVLRIDCLGFLF